MHIFESIRSSFQNIFSHKLRSSLTLLGIMIGVFAVVTMFSSINGMKKMINDNMSDMGWNNSIIIYPSSGEEHGSSRRHFWYRSRRDLKPLNLEDYQFIRSQAKAKYIYGYISQWQKYNYQNYEDWVRLTATNNDFFRSKTYPLLQGRYFNAFEEQRAAKVCVIGYHFAEKYFGDTDPINQTITLGKNRFLIIGVLKQDELNRSGMNFNNWERKRDLESVYIPLSTGSLYLRSSNAIDYLYLQAYDDGSYDKLKTQTTQNLLVKHNMSRDFSFNDIGSVMMEITAEINEMMKKWNITLSAIASISLLVGGIGLFSTLLISINERMKEIGIRKSIGATEFDIFLHFLSEAIVLALIGAFVGVLLSVFLVQIISTSLDFNFPIPVRGILLGLAFALFIGIFSGLYPAIKASKINPIKAIYYFE